MAGTNAGHPVAAGNEMEGRKMDYEDAVVVTVSKKEAQREVEKHACEWAEFVAEMGDKATYKGGDVLAWLGY